MARLSWPEMREYWERHGALRASVDPDGDPDALGNVCHPGRPLWLNRYYARFQRRVYRNLLAKLPPPVDGTRALDVGCGAGRWSKLLSEEGYATVGIDLQPGLIEANRRRYPQIEFHRASIQEFTANEPFDLISTVTVIQHIPFDAQGEAVARLRALTRDGGHVLALENLRDQGPHVFSRSPQEWEQLFAEAGFELVERRRYDYSPFLRALERLTSAVKRRRSSPASSVTAQTLFTEHDPGGVAPSGFERSVQLGLMRACVLLDSLIEPACLRLRLPLPTVHAGLVFRAV